MASSKGDVLWSPVHHDKFIVWGPDITLFEVARLKEIEKKTSFTQISPTRGATVVASQSASGVRCVDISAIAEQPDPLLALGHSNGRIQLATLKQTYDPLGLSGREFVPRYSRPCNSVAWSSVDTNLLASGLDKYRSDHCILLWDINRSAAPEEQAGPSTSGPTECAKPVSELGLSETAHSVSWGQGPRSLIAAMNLKHIKIFDLRDLASNKPEITTTSRYLYGACSDPFNPWQVASRGDNVICIWDTRAFDRPLLTLPQPKAVVKIQWCPTRRNLLMSLQRDSTSIRLHDIQQTNSDKNTQFVDGTNAVEAELEEQYSRGASAVERAVSPAPCGPAPPLPAPLAAAAWHPAHPQRLLALSHAGALTDYTVCERVTVAWGARRGVAWSMGGARLNTMGDEFYASLKDISHTMRMRAATHYGLKPDLWQNADLADDESLSGLWHFLALSKSLVEDGCIRNSPWKHPGVRAVLKCGEGGYRSEMVPSLLPDLPTRRVTIYRSAERSRALQLCGWGWGWENAGAGVERLEAEGTPCRAAATAAFHLRLRTAIDVLARAREPQLRVVALALAGLSEERLWREAVREAAPALPDAYLRALLHFLAASASASAAASAAPQPPQDMSAVLNETEMRLEDRVAFACIFLSDASLHEYIQQTTDQLLQRGDLSGVLLTGASPEGIQLFQRWVEHSGDVQTCALVAARCLPAELLQDPRPRHWLDSYRSILDSWRCWWARSALDTWVRSAEGGGAGGGAVWGGAARAVGVACSYCGKGVAAPLGPPRPRHALARQPPPPNKCKQISSCPNCRKPLPRCAVCSLHLGTGAGGGGAGGGAVAGGAGGAPFAAWFSWCVQCRHGGHAHHIIEWFKEHSECPVSSCNCRCSTLDAPDRF